MAESPVVPICVAGTVETVVFERIVPGIWRVLFVGRLLVEMWSVRKGEEPDSKEEGQG